MHRRLLIQRKPIVGGCYYYTTICYQALLLNQEYNAKQRGSRLGYLSDERPIVGGCRLLSWRPETEMYETLWICNISSSLEESTNPNQQINSPGPLTSGRHLDDGSSLPQTASKTFGGTRPTAKYYLKCVSMCTCVCVCLYVAGGQCLRS